MVCTIVLGNPSCILREKSKSALWSGWRSSQSQKVEQAGENHDLLDSRTSYIRDLSEEIIKAMVCVLLQNVMEALDNPINPSNYKLDNSENATKEARWVNFYFYGIRLADCWPLERERKEIHPRAKAEPYDLALAPFPNVMLLLTREFCYRGYEACPIKSETK